MRKPYLFSSRVGWDMERYLALKRALGRKYSGEQRILENLDRFLASRKSDLTSEAFTRWCHTHTRLSSGVRRHWMRNIRNFCLYRQRTDRRCFVPDISQFPAFHQPIKPHIFCEGEVARILNVADGLESNRNPLRRETIRVSLVLLYTCGLRRGELIRLTIGDYDPQERTLLIRESKFHKSRILPLSRDAQQELESYFTLRRKSGITHFKETPLIWSVRSKTGAYSGGGLYQEIRFVFQQAGIRTKTGQLPRVHDLRHSFAVQALLRWYRNGDNVQAKLPVLSIYMGHVSVVSTQYYLHFVEELSNFASKCFETRYGALVSEFEDRK